MNYRRPCRYAPLCWAAGCCSEGGYGATLSLWYSATRDDHFSDTLNCSAGCGGVYAYMHAQGVVAAEPGPGRVALNLYWNGAPAGGNGAGGDNVASTFPPAQPGYALARVMGYVYAAAVQCGSAHACARAAHAPLPQERPGSAGAARVAASARVRARARPRAVRCVTRIFCILYFF